MDSKHLLWLHKPLSLSPAGLRALAERAKVLEGKALESNTLKQYASAIRSVEKLSTDLLPMDSPLKVGLIHRQLSRWLVRHANWNRVI